VEIGQGSRQQATEIHASEAQIRSTKKPNKKESLRSEIATTQKRRTAHNCNKIEFFIEKQQEYNRSTQPRRSLPSLPHLIGKMKSRTRHTNPTLGIAK
jgi:hypothetical protein